jgi:hypothetical protein
MGDEIGRGIVAKIVLEGGYRTWPWTSPACQSRGARRRARKAGARLTDDFNLKPTSPLSNPWLICRLGSSPTTNKL